MKIQESAENYLETILVLRREKGAVRSIDVVQRMNFSKPSVSHAMGLLRTGGYVNMDANGYLTLTEAGAELAGKIYERHQILTKILVMLGVNAETAAEDACKMEHDISDESFAALKRHVESMEKAADS